MAKRYKIAVELEVDETEERTADSILDEVKDLLDCSGARLIMADLVTSPDLDFGEFVKSANREIEDILSLLEERIDKEGAEGLFGPGLRRIDDGLTWVTATAHTLETMHAKAAEMAKQLHKMPFGVQVTPKNVHEMPDEVLHTVAHIISHQTNEPDCTHHEAMNREQLIDYIKTHMERDAKLRMN